MDPSTGHYGLISLLPAIIALGLAIWTKRVIESLLAGILSGVLILDATAQGWSHSLLHAINNMFGAITGHAENMELGLRGMGILKGKDRPEVLIVLLLLGAFIAVLEKSGGAFAFGEWLSKKVKTRRGAENAAAIMGCSLFTSAYFSALATGTVFRPIYERMKISKARLAFVLDSTSAPINTIIPISGWLAYMSILMVDNIPSLKEGEGLKGLALTVPVNFYCILLLLFVFLYVNGMIKDYGPMKQFEERAQTGEDITPNNVKSVKDIKMKGGRPSDMIVPLGVSIAFLVILGLWNYTFAKFFTSIQRIPLSGNEILIISFFMGIVIAYIKYICSGLMKSSEFLEEVIEGTKTAIIGGMIIVLAVTLGDLMRAAAPEGMGAALFLKESASSVIPKFVVPCAVFIISSFMGFCMGTSWGVWAIMMPIAIPLTSGGDYAFFVSAAAVLSGGTFGDHCSPISDTTIMSSIGAGCNHMDHVNTQIPYALTAGSTSALFFLICGFIF